MKREVWIVSAIALVNSLSFTVLLPTLYPYGRQFGLNDFETSFLFSIFSIAQFIATPVIGQFSDRWGRRPLLLVSLAGTMFANLMAGLATAAWVLFLARFLDGITGGNNSVIQAVIADVTDAENRARGFSLFGAAFGVGFVLGPLISLGAQEISLGASFLVSAWIAGIALGVTYFFLPETLEERSQPRRFELGLAKLVTGLTIPKVGILLLINFLVGTTFTIFTYAFQPYFLNVLNQTPQSLALIFIVYGVLGVLMQTFGVPNLTKRFNLLLILFVALLIRSVAFLAMPIWPNVTYFVLITIFFSVFNSLVQPIINTLISLNVNAQQQGMAMGLNSSYLSISNGIGPVIAGVLIRQSNLASYGYPLYLAGACTFGVLLLAIQTRTKYAPS
ncbi:tetracycline resistance MFS efflux pump [Acaryochloris sp. CCMEE 5410]|uniref:MFS transporter n=1 Tax=Acaryochloris sp. CCMEE 5410 TaxID=310037 RepID=UPI0002484695|nr:tetracycline resistance MFS efflux pump [Acaryochloris sp. CCMEE 5410]KAI9134288.1 tetracycline resistance MFS efflux pump [Acaryochloris sp. CCMEE 5410]